METKTITIKDEQAEWVALKCINLSRLVQKAIDREMYGDSDHEILL